MRTLSATLLADQKRTDRVDALIKVVLTHGVTTYTYTRTRIIDIKHDEEPFSHKATLQVDNSDSALTTLDLQGYQAVISYGVNTSAGEEYSDCAPMWVTGQRFESSMTGLFCYLECIGIPNLLAEQRAEADYIPEATDTKTVKTIINDMFDGTMTAFSNSPTYTIDWDSEDGLIDTFIPKDHFRIYIGGSRLGALRRLLDYTGCSVRFGNDGHIHIFVVPMKELVYEGSANSYVNCGAINNAAAKFWVSLKFKLSSNYTAGSGYMPLWSKLIDVNNYIQVFLDTTNGKLTLSTYVLGSETLNLASTQTSWTAGTWYHVIASISNVAGSRLVIEKAALTDATVVALPNGGNVRIGDNTLSRITGVIANVFQGTDDLTASEETALYYDSPPSDATEIYRLDEGEGLVAYNLGSSGHANDGTIGSANTWQARTTYDYEYSLASGYHTFFAKAYRKRLVIPNRFVVKSQADDSPQYTGTAAVDADSYAALGMYLTQTERIRLASAAQGTSIGAALLLKYQTLAQAGSGEVPMNVGAEVYDYVRVTDIRENDSRAGTIGYIHRRVNLRKATWSMTFGFGGWATSRGLLNELETDTMTSAGLSQYMEKLAVKDLYAENIKADQIDLTTIDQDDIQDGTTYGRVKNTHLDSNGIKVSSITTFNAGYDPSTKRRNFTAEPTTPYDVGDLWHDATTVKRCTTARASGAYVAGDWTATTLDAIANGTTYSRVQTAALTAAGLVLLDQVEVGTYGLVLTTDISAGHILLSTTVKTGEWYDESGVEIDADTGINIYGTDNALTTRATKTGTIQCYVGADGAIYAAAGIVKFNANGITITRTDGGDLTGMQCYYGATNVGGVYPGGTFLAVGGSIETCVGGTRVGIYAGTGFGGSGADNCLYLGGYLNVQIQAVTGGITLNGTFVDIPRISARPADYGGRIYFDTDDSKNYIYDLSTTTWKEIGGSGGGIAAVVDDATPQLGGDLDVNDSNITSVADHDITIQSGKRLYLTSAATYATYITRPDMLSGAITSVADPTNAQDAATKNYVDGRLVQSTQSQPTLAVDTVYQNTTGGAIFLSMEVAFATISAVQIFCDSSNPPTTLMLFHSNVTTESVNELISFIVPNNYYYKLYKYAGTVSISTTAQYTLEI